MMVRESEELFEDPCPDYTRDLLGLMPRLEGLPRRGLDIDAHR